MKVKFRVKKNGVWWTIGEIADYQLKTPEHLANKRLLEDLKGSSKKVRLIMPPENFNAFQKTNNNANVGGRGSNIINTSFDNRSSTSSSSMSVSG